MRDKAGNKITIKEFFHRWKIGIDNITPIQKLRNDVRGTFITLLGFIVAMIAAIWQHDKIGLLAYGLILIFLGSIITTGLKWLALKQQLRFLKGLDLESSEVKDEKSNKD